MQHYFLVFCAFLLGVSFARIGTAAANLGLAETFGEWKILHGKTYGEHSEEHFRRLKVFESNSEWINEYNSKGLNHKLGLGPFADLTSEEFLRSKPRIRSRRRTESAAPPSIPNDVPPAIDWRKHNAVTAVGNEAACGGACWAFAAIGAVEGFHAIQSGSLVSLSAQELVDCDKASLGCDGGYVNSAFVWIIENGGIASRAAYPFRPQQPKAGACNTSVPPSARIKGYGNVTSGCRVCMEESVAKQPVAVAVWALSGTAGKIWQHYKSGVMSDVQGCNATQLEELDHAVLVVGYGATPDANEEYWIVKNDWGEKWGDNGYIYLGRNVQGATSAGVCGITLDANYPF
jgi:C1A family cysteine protease|eukprot:g5501.t1